VNRKQTGSKSEVVGNEYALIINHLVQNTSDIKMQPETGSVNENQSCQSLNPKYPGSDKPEANQTCPPWRKQTGSNDLGVWNLTFGI